MCSRVETGNGVRRLGMRLEIPTDSYTSKGVHKLSSLLLVKSLKEPTGDSSATVLACTKNPLNISPPPETVTKGYGKESVG